MKTDAPILPKLWTLPDSIRNRIGREAGPQRAMLEEGHLLVILHQVPAPDEHTRKAALFWRQPTGEWKSNLEGGGIAALGGLLKSYEAKLTNLEDAENAAHSATEYHRVLENLAPVLRTSRGLHRTLQQAREMMKSERDLINFRDQAAAIERNAELLLQDAQFGLNFTVAKQAEVQAINAQKMAGTAHRLNMLAALFLPLTTLAGVFGMNVDSGIKNHPANFFFILALGVLMGGGLSFLISRARR